MLWLIYSVAGGGSHPTKQRKQSLSLNKTESDWADSGLRNSRRVGGADVVSCRYVKTGHERSKSRTSRFTNIHTLLHSMLSSTGTQSSFTLSASFCIKVRSEQTVTLLSVEIKCYRRAEYTVGGRRAGTFGDITQPTCLAALVLWLLHCAPWPTQISSSWQWNDGYLVVNTA